MELFLQVLPQENLTFTNSDLMARYNALGRLRQIAFFQPDVIRGERVTVQQINEKFETVCRTFNTTRAGHPVELLVFYNSDQVVPVVTTGSADARVHFFGMPCINRLWTQDIFSFRDSHHLFILDDGTEDTYRIVLDQLKLRLPPLTIATWPVMTESGSILTGRCENEDYVLLGPNGKRYRYDLDCDYTRIKKHLDINRMIDVAVDKDPGQNNTLVYDLLYHADLYLTPVGPLDDDKNKECIFYAKAEGSIDGLSTDKINSKIESVVSEIQTRLGEKGNLTMIPVPLLLINNRYAVSYNNMIPENYFHDYPEQHIKRLYLPDYSMNLPIYIADLIQTTHREEDNNVLLQELVSTSGNMKRIAETLPGYGGVLSKKNVSSVVMPSEAANIISKKQEMLKVELETLGFEVHFIQMDDNDYSIDNRSAAGLHCRSKVVHRDHIL
jgi:hypothetical protein